MFKSLCPPWTVECQPFLSFTISQSLLKYLAIESMVLSNSLIFCHPLLLLPSMCSESDISNESILPIWYPKYWRSSVSINPSNEYAALSYFKKTGLISLLAKGLSRVFSNTAIQKHQLFSIQPSLWSSSHIHTWLLEKQSFWLHRPLLEKQYLCFLIQCLSL